MPRLFIAVDLPAAATAELARIEPLPMPGMRLIAQDQMHLTLHYLGEADVERMGAALQAVALPAFSLTLERVGRFAAAGGAVTLWVGVRDNPQLLRLHAEVAGALAGEGFLPEKRRYSPHITLARCKPVVPASVVSLFLEQHAAFLLPDLPVVGFGLYSSSLIDGVRVYLRERAFRLLA
ncbi:RNA 2',3'-cyclic phosphodiesterase [Paraherbaspirillum soli]|uniref:RNA 2',3'-cyclic phosphodiesterase n=1 Tax=Paraherbaspirillum soli TaxID=631222 RepID=A0ABW0MC22_9BURK